MRFLQLNEKTVEMIPDRRVRLLCQRIRRTDEVRQPAERGLVGQEVTTQLMSLKIFRTFNFYELFLNLSTKHTLFRVKYLILTNDHFFEINY